MNRRTGRRWVVAASCAIATLGAAGFVSAARPARGGATQPRRSAATTPGTTISSSSPSAVSLADPDVLRQAKIGLLTYLAGNVDRPDKITGGCVVFPDEQRVAFLDYVHLLPSTRAYTPTVAWTTGMGAGIVGLRCAQDAAAAARPFGASAFALDVAVLDGQASFAQYAVGVGGANVTIRPVDTIPGAQLAVSCDKPHKACAAAIGLAGLAISVHLDHLPPATSADTVSGVAIALLPDVVARLVALPGP